MLSYAALIPACAYQTWQRGLAPIAAKRTSPTTRTAYAAPGCPTDYVPPAHAWSRRNRQKGWDALLTIGSKVERAYRRDDLLAKRVKLREAWARHCATLSKSGNVVAIRR